MGQLVRLADLKLELIESNTERLFLADLEAERQPHICPECGEGGRYAVLRPMPGKFIYQRPPCACERAADTEEERVKAERELARKTSVCRNACRLVGKLAPMRLDNLHLVPALDEAVASARRIVEDWPNGRGLILSGPFGCGKTHITAGIVNALVDKGIRAEFWPGFELLQSIRKSYDNRDAGDVCERFSELDLLAYDDLGNERIAQDSKGDWAREQLFRIFYWRDAYERPLVVTTNYSVDELMDKVGGAIVSRLLGLCAWHEIRAGDWRVKGMREPAKG